MSALSKVLALAARPAPPTSKPRRIGAIVLGSFLAFAGTSHLSFARQEFQAQVPEWVPLNEDAVVLLSGVVEISLGAALILLPKRRVPVGLAAAAFFIAIFPGNISQYVTHTDAFGLSSDRARLARLFFQPPLVLWALWSTGAWKALRAELSSAGRTRR
ncbi:DoxX family protein [Arthrobacter yangruifuii]|uniref:DoxX family protein n=1 Tax=Arthrobacter yangruifuii TaxID=2606616 RepID=UPI001AEE77C4|nr:hypothetical protein [Arthrobacter yangruifuii]